MDFEGDYSQSRYTDLKFLGRCLIVVMDISSLLRRGGECSGVFVSICLLEPFALGSTISA